MLTMVEKKYKRQLVDEIVKYLDSRDVLVIYGARQVGKTTLMKYLIEHYLKENVFYFDLELQNLLELCNAGADGVYNYLIQKEADEKKRIFLLIDEIQYLDNPAQFLKIFHDHYPLVKLIVSGSSTFEIKRKIKQSLVGRIVAFELYPLSFSEFLIFKEEHYKLAEKNTEAINQELVKLAE